MKKRLLITGILLTGTVFASNYYYIFKVNDLKIFNQQSSNIPTMQDSTPQERTGIQSTGQILASDGGVDWYGEVSSTNLINGNDLASLISLTEGISINSEIGWLHIRLDNKELFIAKKPLRHSITWGAINNQEAVFGNRTIQIKGLNYKVRLFKCTNNSATTNSGYDLAQTHGSEWNRVMYRITNNTYRYTENKKDSETPFINLANYSETSLILNLEDGYGNNNWCQETDNAGNKVIRGRHGVSYKLPAGASNNGNWIGWRPILEKVN